MGAIWFTQTVEAYQDWGFGFVHYVPIVPLAGGVYGPSISTSWMMVL